MALRLEQLHKPVLVDLRDDEPVVTALPNGFALAGKTFVRTRDGEVEVAPSSSPITLADELKTLWSASS